MPFLLQTIIVGAGGEEGWRRFLAFLAQVEGRMGAGVEKGWGPATPQRAESHFAAQGPSLKSHLRPLPPIPAPEMGITCAKKGSHLYPATLICANDGFLLRREDRSLVLIVACKGLRNRVSLRKWFWCVEWK